MINYRDAHRRQGIGMHSGCCDFVREQLKKGPMGSRAIAEASNGVHTWREVQQALNVLTTKQRTVATNGKNPATYSLIVPREMAVTRVREFRPRVYDKQACPFERAKLAMLSR